jgi:hypothetical protein
MGEETLVVKFWWWFVEICRVGWRGKVPRYLLTEGEMAKDLGVPTRQVKEWRQEQAIRCYFIGKTPGYDPEEVRRALRRIGRGR